MYEESGEPRSTKDSWHTTDSEDKVEGSEMGELDVGGGGL
jgi:hypothetical protein